MARGQVLAELAAGLKALERASAGIAELRSNDPRRRAGRGPRRATFIDVMYIVIDKQAALCGRRGT